MEMLNVNAGDKNMQRMRLSLAYCTLWMIWKARNASVFRNERRAAMLIADDISTFTFNWIKNRTKFKNIDCSTVSRYVDAVRGLECEILGLMAKGIGVPPSLFKTFLTDNDSDSLFRLNHYPPVTDTSSSSSFHRGNTIGFGEHSDPQILTILTSNGVPGLQISLGNGNWVPVNSDPQGFCVIVGDLLQVMTNGRFKSVRHRAMANTSSRESRLSMVFFGGPPPQTAITCPPQLLKPNKPPLYKPFTWAEYKSHTYAHRLGETRLDHFKLLP